MVIINTQKKITTDRASTDIKSSITLKIKNVIQTQQMF